MTTKNQMMAQAKYIEVSAEVRYWEDATVNGIKSGAIDLDKARAINEVSKTIIDTAKVEVDYLKVNNGGESAFIEASQPQPLPSGIVGITRHVLKG